MPGHRHLSAAEYLHIWRRRWNLALLLLLLGGASGYALSRFLPHKYTATQTLESLEWAGDARAPGPPLAVNRIAEITQQVLTPKYLQDLAARYPIDSARSNFSPEGRVEAIRRNIVIQPQGMAYSLSFTAGDETAARDVCLELSRLFIVASIPANEANAPSPLNSASVQFVAKQVADARKQRDERDGKLAEFKRVHASELNGRDVADAPGALADYNRQLQATDATLKSAQEKRAALTEALFTRQLAATKTSKPAESPQTQALEQELAAKQTQLVTLQARYTADHPDVVKLKADIADLQKKIDDAKRPPAARPADTADAANAAADAQQIQTQIRALDRQIEESTRERDRLQREIQSAQARMDNGPVVQMQYAELKSAADLARDDYDRWTGKQAELQKALSAEPKVQRPTIGMSGGPQVALTFPLPGYFIFGGAVLGLAVSLLATAAVAMRDKSMHSAGDVQYFLELPTLAVIPPAGAAQHGGEGGATHGGRMGNRGEKEESVSARV